MNTRTSILDRRRSVDRLQADLSAGVSLLDGDTQEHVEVRTGKRLQSPMIPVPELPETPEGAPMLTALEPNTVAIGQPNFDIHVMGEGFVDGDVIVFNGNDEPTTFVSDTELTTGINMAVWTAPSAPLPVKVRNAEGVESNELTFTFTAATP